MPKVAASSAVGLAFGSALASLCCLPVASGALGITLAALGAAVSPWWPLLAGGSLVFLTVAVVQTARGGGDAKANHCETRNRRQRRWLFLGIVVFVTLALLGVPWWSALRAQRSAAPGLQNLRGLDELRTRVDGDKTIPRLVLLLSPT